MGKTVAWQDRKTVPVITQLTPALRARVEELAARERVSLSEIGRRALTQYVEQQQEG